VFSFGKYPRERHGTHVIDCIFYAHSDRVHLVYTLHYVTAQSTIGSTKFQVAATAAKTWNDLDVTWSPKMRIFRKTLKNHLFRQSYYDNVP